MRWLAERRRDETTRPTAGEVSGERAAPAITRRLSLQARVSNALALGFVLAVGLALLAWYYAHTAQRPARVRQSAQARTAGRAQAEMPLPALGPIRFPMLAPVVDRSAAAATTASAPADALTAVPGTPLSVPPLPRADAPLELPVASSAPPPERPQLPSAQERRLAGPVFIGAEAPSALAAAGGEAPAVPQPTGTSAAGGSELHRLLATDSTPAATARVVPTQQLLLPKGAFIDCTLETAIDSSLPGMTSCVTASDTFSADGSVVLLDRGTKLVGETRGQVQLGSARVFVVWSEARTPSGVVVPLDSPGADELGRSGLPGEVERHFWQRFGAAILISTIDGAVQAAVQSSAEHGGTVIYNPSASTDVMSEVLKSSLNIAPTIIKRNGDRIQVLVARDVDFRAVYELRRAGEHP
jgi:type IV secretion system protein VirB10